MAVGHNWLSVRVYLNSSLSIFSNYTQLSTVIMGCSKLSGKSLLVQPQRDLQVSGNKVWFGDRILELPGQLEALRDGRGRRIADAWERVHAAAIHGLSSARSINLMWCFPESGMLEEQAISGLKEAPGNLLTSQCIYSLQVNTGEVNGKMTEQKGFVVLAELALESERPKIWSQHLAVDWRWDLEMEQFIKLKLKIEVSMLYKGQDEDISVKLTLNKRE